MKAVGTILAIVVGVGVGAAAFGLLAEMQLGGEATALGARFGIPSSRGGAGQVLGFLDNLDPGASTRIKQAAAVTAVGGAAAAVVAYALAREAFN